ncbi:hypothetical protein M0R45_003982 [Rubus argutus]|uniref:ADP-ribosyl cyclase/cyclic ADP-ribose hydrolase n=1 Tax=Rubus argutus TaxID=59490 RepID=A0AAW1YGR0_RUBAR
MASSYQMRASTSAASASKWEYDVFLSFRGEDTRNNFTDHLYDKLQWRGIKAFRDDPELERERFGADLTKVQQWRDALKKVADLAGWTSNNDRYETLLIKEIVEALWKKVHPTFASSESESLDNLVGIDSKLMAIEFLLETKASDVCFIGIWGMGGIGKTTLARLVYQKISHHFEVGIFLAKVGQTSATRGLDQLQEQLICQILNEKNFPVWNVDYGRSMTKRCLFNKKVLLVLDDVDQLDQLENLAGGKDWFGSGSIVIVTTRDQRLLVSHGIEKRYKCKGLNQCEARQLFNWYAFKKDHPEEGYRELSESILDYARGLPLALKILGSFLYKRDRGGWESAVAKLKKAPIDQKLFEVLRISYDGLDEMSQQVFLDVVCFLKGNDKERVIEILDSIFGFDTRVMINVLIEKSLLTSFDNCVDMHDLIREMGLEIVRLESKAEPGQRSRLWLRDDIFCVLKENVGTEAIRSITLCLPKLSELTWNPNAFFKMSKLKFLKMDNLVLCQGPKYLPDSIRVLEWTLYPSKSLPPNFQPVEIIEIILHHSNINQLWDGIKYLEKLTLINLSYSENLIMTPDFTGIQNLERLVLEGCTNLVDIHPSITSLRRLKVLNLKNCRSIKSLPSELEMDSLEIIDLSGCSKVNIFPQFVARMEKLSGLSFSGIGTQNFKVSGHSVSPVLAYLKHFFLKGLHLNACNSVSPHPLSLVLASLKHFCSLKRLNLNDCKLGEGAIPDDIGCLSSLEDLDLSVNDFVSLPATINLLYKLKCLNLVDCKRLEQLPDLPLFSGTCYVAADNCISLEKLPDPPAMCRLWKLSFNFINCCSIAIEDEKFSSSGERCRFKPYFNRIACEYEVIKDDDQVDGVSSGSEDDGEEGDIEDDGVSSYIIYSMLQRFLQEPPPYFERFGIVIPGNKIPAWFRNQSVGASVRIVETDCSSCRSTLWVGFALCVLFGPKEDPGALGEDPDLRHHANTISCSWSPVRLVPAGFIYSLNKVVKSDHLCLFLLPLKYYLPEYGDSDGTSIDFSFKADPCLKVKKCGIRPLYKQDVKELNSRMNHRNKSISARKRYHTVQEPPLSDEVFSSLFRGNDIPVWFTNTSEGSSVRQMIPCSSCSGKWMSIGFVVCVLFGAAALGEDHDLEPHANRIFLYWLSGRSDRSSYLCDVDQVELSDQLCVLFVPMNKVILHSDRFVTFFARTRGAACLKVKRCGVRTLYMQDVIEHSPTMNYWPERVSRWDRIPDLLQQLKSTSHRD